MLKTYKAKFYLICQVEFIFNFFEFDENLEISTENLPKNPYLQEQLSSDATTCQEQMCTLVYFLSLNSETLLHFSY